MQNSFSGKIVIIGAGITGLVLAHELSKKHGENVLVLEREDIIGGLSATVKRDGLIFDLGSHRLHRDISQDVQDYIENTLGVELLKRQRNGKLFFRGKYINYPPNLHNFLGHFTTLEILGFISSYLQNFFQPYDSNGLNYQDAMVKAVGWKIYRAFYEGYAEKLWGKNPRDISVDGKRKRTVGDFKTLRRSLLGKSSYYYYPRDGIGSIPEALAQKALRNNAQIITGVTVRKIVRNNNRVAKLIIEDRQGVCEEVDVGLLISTILIDDLYEAAFSNGTTPMQLDWRGAKLVHALIDQTLQTNTETYYFPGREVTIGRLSDITKYSPYLDTAKQGTVLTLEIPLSEGDVLWNMDDAALLDICYRDLVNVNIFQKDPRILDYYVTRLMKTYPIYTLGWEKKFFDILAQLNQIENLYTIGRGGLYLHCNIDHCIEQGLTLAKYLLAGEPYDKSVWGSKTKEFLTQSARD
jgi:protoporphyrinogen oxidase